MSAVMKRQSNTSLWFSPEISGKPRHDIICALQENAYDTGGLRA